MRRIRGLTYYDGSGNCCAAYDWHRTAGAVYLLRCRRTGEYKAGGTINPFGRVSQLIASSRARMNRELFYVWSIATNGLGRYESFWLHEWEQYLVGDTRREWFHLPQREVARFKSRQTKIYRDLSPIPRNVLADLSPPVPPVFLKYAP